MKVDVVKDGDVIVMTSHGRTGVQRWLLGSVAERTVRGATCPVIVTPAKKTDSFNAWSKGARNLRVVVAVDLGESAPVEVIRTFRKAGACDVTAVHLYWPPSEMKRHEIAAPFDVVDHVRRLEQVVEQAAGERHVLGEDAEAIEEVAIQYGAFVNTLIQFLIVAFVIFLLVKAINTMRRAYPQFMAAGGENLPPDVLRIIFPLDFWPLITKYAEAHDLLLEPGGWLQRLAGGAARVRVNSLHGQGVDVLAPGLTVEAVAHDGLVEAYTVDAAHGFTLAVQWHPEWRISENPDSRKIFAAFGQACRDYQQRKA